MSSTKPNTRRSRRLAEVNIRKVEIADTSLDKESEEISDDEDEQEPEVAVVDDGSDSDSDSGDEDKSKSNEDDDDESNDEEHRPKRGRPRKGTKKKSGGEIRSNMKKKKQAIREFESYKDRLDDWRKLTDKEQNSILRYLYGGRKKKGITHHCLSSQCSIVLSTSYGLQYHMKRCGLSIVEQETKCSVCLEKVLRSELAQHKLEKHGQSAMYIAAPMVRTPRPKRAATATATAIITAKLETEHDEAESPPPADVSKSSANRDESFNAQKRRRRSHLSLAKANWSGYRSFMTKIYESFKAQAYTKDPEDFFENGVESMDWTILDKEDAEPYLSYLNESVRFSVDEEKETKPLKTFEVRKTQKGFVGFCGSALAMAIWCPMDDDKDEPPRDQYVFVALSNDSMMQADEENLCGTFQVWKLASDNSDFRLQYVIAHDYGSVYDVRWCPSGQWKPSESRLGAVAVTSSIGEVGIYLIRSPMESDTSDDQSPLVYKPAPYLKLYSGTDSLVYSVDWSPYKGHDEIVAGLADGSVVLWRLSDRNRPYMLDENGRLQPALCFEAADGPVRYVRWWSETKVILNALDRQISLWDLQSGTCIGKYAPLGQAVAFDCPGSFYPAVVFSSEAYQNGPSATYVDFMCAAVRSTMPVGGSHASIVWAMTFNPWTSEFLTVDDSGIVCRTCASLLDGILDSKRRRYIDEVVLNSTIQTAEGEEIYDYGEARKRCSIKFSYKNKAPSKAEVDRTYREHCMSGQFPIAAIFTASWNTNKEHNRLCCFGGQTGLLHVVKFEDFK